MKLIRVKSCEDCPFSLYDDACDNGFYCNHGGDLRWFDDKSRIPETIPEWCPLPDAEPKEQGNG